MAVPPRLQQTEGAAPAPGFAGDDFDRMQLALRESEERFRAVLDAMPANVYAVDLDGRIVFCNRHWLAYSGMTVEDTVEGRAAEAIHPDDQPQVVRVAQAARAKERAYENEMRVRRFDGVYRWHMSRTVPVVVDGQLRFWVGVNIDIDARKRRELVSSFLARAGKLLSESLDVEQTLSAVTELAVPDLADWCRIDLAGEDGAPRLVSYANAHPARMAMAADLQTRFRGRRDAEPPAARVMRTGQSEIVEHLEPLIAEALAQHPEFQDLLEFEFKSALTVPIKLRERNLGAITLATAESGRRLTEADVSLAEEFADRLAFALEHARLYRDLQRVAEELTAANRAKDDFLGLVSHELRTPLTTLKGMANVLRRHGERVAPEERAGALLDIERGAEQLQRIVENMLVLAHAEQASVEGPEPLLLRRVLERIVKEQRAHFQDTPIDLKLPDELMPVVAYESYVRQVLVNLLSNAIKYNRGNGPVEVELELAGREALISVRDRGIGIEPERIAQVFDPFFRSSEGKARASGVGLGLTVCKRLVEHQGGRIWASAREGGGTEFRFTLPLAPEFD
jgi:PAS domain S-box-containing protein